MSLFEVLYTIILCDVQTAIVKLKSDFYKECPHTAAPSSMCQIKIHIYPCCEWEVWVTCIRCGYYCL